MNCVALRTQLPLPCLAAGQAGSRHGYLMVSVITFCHLICRDVYQAACEFEEHVKNTKITSVDVSRHRFGYYFVPAAGKHSPVGPTDIFAGRGMGRLRMIDPAGGEGARWSLRVLYVTINEHSSPSSAAAGEPMWDRVFTIIIIFFPCWWYNNLSL